MEDEVIEKIEEVEIIEEQPSEPVETQPVPKNVKAARIIAIIVFSLIMGCIVLAFVTDLTIFSKQIIGFIAGVLGGAMVFIMGFFLMLISIVLIFGVYLLEERGFWPAQWASQVFHEALHDAALTQDQIVALIAVRIVLLILCAIGFAGSIVAICMAKAAKKKNPDMPKQKLTMAFSIIALIFSIFGIFAAITIMILSKALL